MNKKLSGFAYVGACVGVLALVSGCATPPRVAQNKSVVVSGTKLDFGGSYAPREHELTLSVNGDPLMRGRFPPYTPHLELNAKFQDMDVNASCDFGSVLNSMGGLTGIIAGAVQAGVGRGGDKCALAVNGKPTETLYF